MATPTFVHIGDFHAGPGPRNADRYRALDQIIAEALTTIPKGDLGAWLWPGDLNHGRMTIEDRNALAARLVAMANAAPVVVCYGNHDNPGDLDVFARLKADWPIYVISQPTTLRIGLAPSLSETASIFVLPYPTKAGLVSAGVAHGDLIPTAADALDAIFMKAAADLEAARAHGDLTLMVGHVNVAGSLASSGQPQIGMEIEIGAQHLDRLGNIPKCLNHIHKAQYIAGARYAGSVCRLSWGEIEPKMFLTVAFNGDGSMSDTQHSIDVAPMYHVEADATGETFTWRCTAGPNGDQQDPPRCRCGDVTGCLSCCGTGVCWTGCEVRVRVRFKQSNKALFDLARVRAEFQGAARLDVEPIALPDRDVRSPQVAAARTLPDKLAAYANLDTLTSDQSAKLALLEHGDAAQLLLDVSTRLKHVEALDLAPAKATVAA